ncbi:YrdB family protein [Rathayibacter soli]|uniref:YrdB family protein n=1 Tax=Rathayibacter soli TaxID=3144168 RepID=UPI0027E5159F|nr:YrdB family protein [Glaciibacter superstes]
MTATRPDTSIRPNDVLQFFIELFAFASLAIWGFSTWPLPWNIVVGIGAPLLAMVLWALFLSPKAVLQIDNYAKALIEIAIMVTAAYTWWDLGQPVVAVVFAVVAAVSGVIKGRKAYT